MNLLHMKSEGKATGLRHLRVWRLLLKLLPATVWPGSATMSYGIELQALLTQPGGFAK
jgi:hypothetical protein